MEDQLWRYKSLTEGQLCISTSSRKLSILFFCMRKVKVKRKSSGTSSCGTIRLELSFLIRCNIFLCGKTKRLRDMRCLNVPPEVMVRFVFMMSTTPCAKMRVRTMIIGMQCPAGTRTRPDTRYFLPYPTHPDSILKIIR